MEVVLVVAQSLAVRRLVFDAEVAAAGLVALESIHAHELAEVDEIRHAPGFLQRLVEFVVVTQNTHVFPEFLADLVEFLDRLLQALLAARHAALVPQQKPHLAMEAVHGAVAFHGKQPVDAFAHFVHHGFELGAVHVGARPADRREVVADRVGQHEITVGQALHERAGAQTVRAVVGKVGFTEDKQPRHVAHEAVIDPQAAHRVVDSREDPHRGLVSVLPGDVFIHLKKVAVALADRLLSEAVDGIGKIKVDAQAAGTDTAPLVADFLGGSRGNIAWREVAEARVFALEKIITGVLGNV